MSEEKQVTSILNKALNVDYGEIENEDRDFLTKFNIKKIIEVLRNHCKYNSLVSEYEDDENKKYELRQKLISFFEYFDVDKTGTVNSCHLKVILVDSLHILSSDEFEGLFFKAEIEGGGFIDYVSFVYKIIPIKGEEEKENSEDEKEEYEIIGANENEEEEDDDYQ